MQSVTCFLDLFCQPKTQVDISLLQKIITNPDPERHGIWERLVKQKYGGLMPNMVTRRIRFVVTKTKDPYLDIVFIFFVCMGFETACQRIITKQLQRKEKKSEHTFFTEEFVKYARHAFTILLRHPVTLEDVHHSINTCVSLLQLTWTAKTVYFSVISTRHELESRDTEAKRRAEELRLKDPSAARLLKETLKVD
jgi:hypothetical protein